MFSTPSPLSVESQLVHKCEFAIGSNGEMLLSVLFHGDPRFEAQFWYLVERGVYPFFSDMENTKLNASQHRQLFPRQNYWSKDVRIYSHPPTLAMLHQTSSVAVTP